MRWLILSLFLLTTCAWADGILNPGAGGGGGIPATGNIALYVASTGNDSNPCSSTAKCLTIQHAVNVAAQYNYQGLYSPTINVADGTYTNVQVVLLALVNCPAGGSIAGNVTTPTNVKLSDAGTAWTIDTNTGAKWLVAGVDFHGSYGGLNVNSYASVAINKINLSGSLTQGGYYVHTYGIIDASAPGTALSISTASMGNFIYSHGTMIMNGSAITVTNAVTMPFFIALDAASKFYAIGMTITNGSNVTASSNGLIMTNGAFFELDATTKVDGSALTTANFPGGNTSIDTTSVFDNSPSNYIFYNTKLMKFTSANPNYTGFSIENTGTGGTEFIFYSAGSTGQSGLTAGQGGLLDTGTGNMDFWWDTTGRFTLGNALGFSAQGSYTANAPDTGLSRLGAASLALGNGTAGDFTGTLKLAHLTATSLINSATTSAVCYNTSTGVFTYDGTVGTCTTSDETLKNIGPRIDDALNRLLKINGFYFTWKDPDKYGQGRQIGVGAQTVEKVFPELVQTGSDGLKSVDYVHMIGPIIEAMRELKADNDNLRACQESLACRLFGP